MAATDIDEAGSRATAEAIGEQGIWRALDVTREVDWEATLAWITATWGPPNVLVASAGISFAKPVTEMTLEEWRG